MSSQHTKYPDPPKDLRAVYADDLLVMSFELPAKTKHVSLTQAEINVLVGLLAGRSNAEIAGDRGCSVRTIANHVASILRKLGVKSRLEVVAKMPQSGRHLVTNRRANH